ncbi:hypothetical protein O0I10_009102 [Lichtheimia ornata]|uniref:RNA polymerase II assembly factor Rtp1 C-terminal domain-containing protein n=1 Tax=Lichtheimia ornata TaxID=688661 RepID=A0AAD7XSF7_9FUNG|nr:uncharacterized protein O0I10_009102 [Lichtheimia ornata]KAJ8655234.1 hypothetical protein O0I10_009102 [Lichtheimia ornata]
MEQLEALFSEASILVSSEKNEETSEIALDDQLAMRLDRLDITRDSTETTKQAFVNKCMQLLNDIQRALLQTEEDNEANRDHMGVRDLRMVHTMLQTVISWGMYPCFLPGVGVPLSKRVKSGYTNHELLARPEADEKHGQGENETRSLFHITNQLVDMIAASVQAHKSFTTVGSILLTRHLPDLYAALLQLAYGPSPTTASSSSSSSSPSTTMPTNPSQILLAAKQQPVGLTRAERDKCARMFMWLFERQVNESDVHQCMESLMLLLGTSPLHPVPAWLRSICGRFLSRILLKPRGVATVLEFTVADVEQVQLDQLEKVSKLVLAVPKQMPSVESYYAVIAPQLVTLLQESVQNPNARASTRQVVTFILGRMITHHPTLSKSMIVDPIVGSFVNTWNKQQEDTTTASAMDTDDQQALSESELELLLRTLHQIMVGGEPSGQVIQAFLDKAVLALYYLYDYTVKSKSGLREMVLDILKTYFRIIGSNEAVNDLKRVVLSKRDLSGSRLAYFAPGSSGGVEMRVRAYPKPLGGNELPLDPAVLVNFISQANNQSLCGDFFVFLLSEYSGLQSLAGDTDPRLMLLILHLITGMQDTLGPEILSKPAQIVGFASNVIHGYVENIERLKEKQRASNSKAKQQRVDITNIVSSEDVEQEIPDDEQVQEDFESLIMAISLLRAVIHENDELDTKVNQLLESTIEPLKKLESYQIEELQAPVQELLLAITSLVSAQRMARSKRSDGLDASKEKYREAMKALQDELLPVRAHGMAMLRDMVLARDPLVSSGEGLDNVLDIFIRLVQDEDSYIYLNAIKGLSALTDTHGNEIIKKLGAIYSDNAQTLDNRLRIGEALLQTVQRAGDALSIYVKNLVKPLETVLNRPQVDVHLRVSALSILSTACQTCPAAMAGMLHALVDWVLNILEIEKAPEIRRAATVVIISLFRGMASETLYSYPSEYLKRTYRTLRYIEDTDPDELTRHQARTALADLDVITRREIFK